MVIKGNARGNPADLAKHLQRADTNERVEVKELRGVAALDLADALKEMDAQGAALRTTRTLYHASINTRADEHMTEAQRTRAIDRLEEKLGLTGQPRAVVEHEKEGRAHFHIVWARADLENMRAIRCDHNYRKHEEVARALEKEFGHEHVQGAHVEREGKKRPERTPSHAEMQQAERTGITPQQASAQITALWRSTDSGKAFAAALEQEGWTLARGDKRDLVLVDRDGEVHSLARRIDGAKAKDVRERMADIDAATLPNADQAKEQQRARRIAREGAEREASAAVVAPALAPEATPAPAPELKPEIPLAPTPEPTPVQTVAARPEPVRVERTAAPAAREAFRPVADKLAGATRPTTARAADEIVPPARAAIQHVRQATATVARGTATGAKQTARVVSGIAKGLGKLADIAAGLGGFFALQAAKSPEQQRQDARDIARARQEHAAEQIEAKKEAVESVRQRLVREMNERNAAERAELDAADRLAARKRDYGGRTRE